MPTKYIYANSVSQINWYSETTIIIYAYICLGKTLALVTQKHLSNQIFGFLYHQVFEG